jgi:hypothetical protein
MFLMRLAVTRLVREFLLVPNQNSKYLHFINTLLALHNLPHGWQKCVCMCVRVCVCACVMHYT